MEDAGSAKWGDLIEEVQMTGLVSRREFSMPCRFFECDEWMICALNCVAQGFGWATALCGFRFAHEVHPSIPILEVCNATASSNGGGPSKTEVRACTVDFL